VGGRPVEGAGIGSPTGSPTADAKIDIRRQVQQIADRVREIAVADAVFVSAVADREMLEIVAVSGADAPGRRDTVGRTWQREDLDRCLVDAEHHGRLRFTPHRSITYFELPEGEHPMDIPGQHGTLFAPLRTDEGELLGVLSADGSVDPRSLGADACDLLEVYAGQARLVLHHLREQDRLVEQLRLAQAARTVLHDAATKADVSALLASLARSVADLLNADGSWVCAETEPGSHPDAASYPAELGAHLGSDICTVVEPVMAECWVGDHVMTDADTEILAMLASHAGHTRALLAAIGSGTEVRGAILVFRGVGDPEWSADERSTLRTLGRQLGEVIRVVCDGDRDRRMIVELRALDRYKRDLVVSVSHDLKTPLTSITLNTELLEAEERTAEGAGQVAAIRRSAERLGRLVDDLMALARAEETPHASRDVDLVDLVHEACQHVEVEAQQREVGLQLDMPDSLPVAVDADAMRRVLIQIVSNAVKFSLPSGQVRLELRRVGDMVEFACSDDGIGIAASEQGTVFNMFGRSDDARARGVPGSGMGLAIAQRIVSRLGGTIDVVSVKDQGARFTVRVPADAAH
jgi:signal transduction histidine kinase